jgi:hypothetical protein
MVRCKICTNTKGKENLLVLKLDFLIKHYGLHKCVVLRLGVSIKKYIISPSNIHVKNDKMYGSTWCNIVVDLFAKRWKVKKNWMEFVSLWHMLKLGHLMIDFEAFKLFFQFLKVKNHLQ